MAERPLRTRPRGLGALIALSAALSLALGACGPDEPTGSGTSGQLPPSASNTLPATPGQSSQVPPLDTASEGSGGLMVDASGRLVIPEAGPPAPVALRPDAPIAAERPSAEEQVGLSIEARFVQRGLAPAHAAPEVSLEGLAQAKKLTELGVAIDLSAAGRMKLRSTSRALPFTSGAELRARYDRWGHLLMWPQATKFRVVAPGALRTLFEEGRLDVTPLVSGSVEGGKPAPKAHGQELRSLVVSSALGKLRLDLATMPEVGLGGPLLCRFLVETIGVDPASPACKAEQVPLAAAIDWAEGGGIDFEVMKIKSRTDLGGGELLVPPPGAEQADAGMPESPEGIFLTADELKNLRTRVIEPTERDPKAPGEGLLAENGLDVPLTLLLDGVPVARVPARGKRYVYGPHPGSYKLEWRSFFGGVRVAPELVQIPALVRSVPESLPAAEPPSP